MHSDQSGVVDLTMQDELKARQQQRETIGADASTADEENALRPRTRSSNATEETELETRPNSTTSNVFPSWIRRYGRDATSKTNLSPQLTELVHAFESSQLASALKQDMDKASRTAESADNSDGGNGSEASDAPSIALQGYKRATLWTQFRILSSRAFKNLYRNPMLMLSHYALSAVLAGAVEIKLLSVLDD